MFFYLSKIFAFLIEPNNFLFICFGFGVFLLFTKHFKLGRLVCLISFGLFFVLGFLPTGKYLLSKLEYRFEKIQTLPNHLDGIIVLGGVVDQKRTFKEGKLVLLDNRDRVDVLENLSKQFPKAKIVFSSGSGSLFDQTIKEADLVSDYLREIVKNPNRLIFERESRNTYENVKFSKSLIQPKPEEKWMVVSSARHIPRSIGIFRKQSWDVIPYAVHYQSWQDENFELHLLSRKGLKNFRYAIHEWLGLFVYYLTGKTSELFPHP